MSFLARRVHRVGMSRSMANVLLFLITMAWGLSYVLLKIGAAALPPFEVLALRFTLASVVCITIFRHRLGRLTKRALYYGFILGSVMYLCSTAIIYGMNTTEASTASFLTSSAIVIVPVAQAIRKRRLPEKKIIFGTIGTTIGTKAAILPLVVAAAPFVARLVETSLREVDKGVIEAAQSMGCTPFQIIWKVILPESKPGLVAGFVTALITILGYGSMAGFIGGGGLGKIAVNYGYNRYNPGVMIVAVVLIVVLVQLFQSVGTRISVSLDHRITDRGGKKRRSKETAGKA